MWNMVWPILVVVGSNCFYNICAKSTPENLNPFGSLTVTYLVGALVSAVLFVTQVKPAGVLAELSKVNWSAFVLGLSIVGLEVGYIFIYRAGWKVSIGSLVANIGLACALVFVGMLLYKETISMRQIMGMLLCLGGLVLISK